jgi:DNA-binding CsgD family transcriptional regulator
VRPPLEASWIAIAVYVLAGLGIFFALLINGRRRLRKRYIRRLQMAEKQYLVRQNKMLLDQIRERESELYDVTEAMISRNKVLGKIKSELDDYKGRVPAARFSQQLYDRINGLINKDNVFEGDWKLFMMHFEQNYKGFFNNVMRRFPNLTPGDLKLCACLRMNLSTKDIASLLCISVRGVEIGRYRLRKKMAIDSAVNLNEYFINNFNDDVVMM